MKRHLTLLLAAAAVFFVPLSCEPKTPEEQNPPEEQDPPVEQPAEGKYKFVASPLKGKWEEGDKIYVHGNIGSWSEVITLTKDNISADGKTANADLGEVTANTADPDGLYAAWPDGSVKHTLTRIGSKTTFESCEGLLTAAYLGSDDTFTFIDVASSLTFKVSGGYEDYAICANNRDGLIVTGFEVVHTSAQTTLTQKQNSGYPYKYGKVESGKPVSIWLPGGMLLKDGVTIFLGKGGKWTSSYTRNGDIRTEAGKTVELGDITSELKDYNGPAPRMPQVVKKTKYGVKGNELSGICLSADEDFLWGVGDDGELFKLSFTGEILSQFHIGSDCEDVCRNPETGDLLVALEPDGVGVVKGPGFNSRVTTLFSISLFKNYGNSGMEGLAYYKDGKVFVGAQANSHLCLCDLATKQVIWEKKMWDKDLVSEIGGLCYDPVADLLWIIDSEAKKVFVMKVDDKDGTCTLMGAYPVGDAANPESVCLDRKNKCMWVGDDYGSTSYLYRYDLEGLDEL